MLQLTLCRFPILILKLYVLHELILFKQAKRFLFHTNLQEKKHIVFP